MGNPSLHSSEVGQRVVGELRKLRSECAVLGVVYDFAGNWKGVLWLLRTVTRMAAETPYL